MDAPPITAANVADYLVARGVFEAPDGLDVEELGGGVSAAVLAVRGGGRGVVVKQARERFRVADEWLVPPERAVDEASALELVGRLLPGSAPPLLDSDPESFALVMEEAPASWRPWKAHLLEGEADPAVARTLGGFLGAFHAGTTGADLGSAESFDAQRVDPYFRTIQRRHPDLAAPIGAYVDRLLATERCLVHGDYSPKNVLAGEDGLWVIDWEIVHRGDPAFDLAFLLSHLLLKAIHRPSARAGYEACAEAFLGAYEPGVEDVAYVFGLAGCLMLARVDGKSPAEYLTDAERERARACGVELLTAPASTVAEAFSRAAPDPLR